MDKVFYEVGKHFLSVGLAVIAFVLIKFGVEGSISFIHGRKKKWRLK